MGTIIGKTVYKKNYWKDCT